MDKIAGPIAYPHAIEDCYGSMLHCWIHQRDEIDRGEFACLECRHAFQGGLDVPHPMVGGGWFCPNCAHSL